MRTPGHKKSMDELREELLRPDCHLGYNHDQLGLYMLSLDVLDLAESELRRAVWLNPFEPGFQVHLAWCLYRRKHYDEARKWMDQVPTDGMSEKEREMKRWIDKGDQESARMKQESPLNRAAADAARCFDPARARETLDLLWQEVRTMDTPSVWRGADVLVKALQAAGIGNARAVAVPADGRTSVAGWLAPVAWQVSEARVEVADEPGVPLADFKQAPQSVAMFSPGTPGNDWVEGGVVVPTADSGKLSPETIAALAPQLRGQFLLLPAGAASIPLNTFAAENGALGVLATSPGPIRDASRYLNYAVPLAADAACLPTFALTPATAEALRTRLGVSPALRLRARVCATRGEGTMPVVVGSVGGGCGLPILLCGHMDEPGANDNASGCALAVEALRVLQALLAEDRSQAQQRAIHFAFSVELRGQLVPLALFRGPLSFEDQWRPEARQRLVDYLGLEPGWGTENWVWRLASCFRGQQTLCEILDEMALIGISIDPQKALKLTRLLVELGTVRLCVR